MSCNIALRPQVPLKPYILWKLTMSAIQIRTKMQIQRQTHRKIQRQRQIKGKPETPIWCDIFLKRRWHKDSEYDMWQPVSKKIQIQTQTQIQRQIQEHPTAYDVICFWIGYDNRSLIMKNVQNMKDMQNMQNMQKMQNTRDIFRQWNVALLPVDGN